MTSAGYRVAGEPLGALGLPTVVVQEGGYDLATLGPLVLAFLEGLLGRPPAPDIRPDSGRGINERPDERSIG